MPTRRVPIPDPSRGPGPREYRRTKLRVSPTERLAALKKFRRRLKRVAEIRERAINDKGQAPQTSIAEMMRSFTYADLSRMTRIPQHTVWMYFAGRREPSFTRGLKLARALGVHPERLWSFLRARKNGLQQPPSPPQP